MCRRRRLQSRPAAGTRGLVGVTHKSTATVRHRGVMVSVDRAFFRAVKTCAVAGEGYKVGPLPGRGASSVSLTSPRQLYQSSTKRVCDINVSERRNCNGETLVRAYTYVGRGRRPSETIIAPGFIPGKHDPLGALLPTFGCDSASRRGIAPEWDLGRAPAAFDPGMNPGADCSAKRRQQSQICRAPVRKRRGLCVEAQNTIGGKRRVDDVGRRCW